MKKQAIVGIDPGINTALVLVDLDGNIFWMNAKKNYSNEEIIKDIVENSEPVLIATDKANVPNKVKEIASKLNTRVFAPSEDLSVQDKIELTKNLNFSGKMKEHLIDAAASALYALNKYKRIIEKAKEISDEEKRRKVIKMVLNNEGLNVKAALDILEKEKIKEPKTIGKKQDIFQKIKQLEEENRKLKEILKALEEELRNRKKEIYISTENLEKLDFEIKLRDQIIDKVKNAIEKEFIVLVIDSKSGNKKFVRNMKDLKDIDKFREVYIVENLFTDVKENIFRKIYVVKRYEVAGPFVIIDPKDVYEYYPEDVQSIKNFLKNILAKYRGL